ncbi:cysteine-rich and transmembrane domain-containing protein WIH2 isoform X3 [Neltuma alba]|uniref:cysteine-rich and transmembrane domain-containing protein WIH2 isoform X3 n=1 Tax=Neltuma alba TaxID=207710 RepID=UPI0010A2F37D|nr:cysteine-rich and transmembrane domain-containing protein WIH2-like isoform X3 [Prosopis alba]
MSQPNQGSEAYPPSTPVMAYPPPGQAYQHHQTPPPGYPTTVQGVQVSSHITPETNSKGEGFWKGCVAAICCCWVLEFCCGC